MPATAEYLTNLKAAANSLATMKKTALQNVLNAYTSADLATLGGVDPKTFKFGQKGPGSRDVQYMQQYKGAEAGAEAAGTLASGQYASTLASQLAQYKGDIGSLISKTESEKNIIDAETTQKLAEYDALYGGATTGGETGGGTGGGAGGKTDSGKTGDSSLPPVDLPPKYDPPGPAYRAPSPTGVQATTTANLPAGYKAQDMAQYTPKPVPQQTPKGVTSNLPSGYKPAGATVVKKPVVPAKSPTKSLTGVRYK